MFRQCIKQAWQLLKRNKLFGGIYIIGAALAISLVMVVVMIYYIKVTPVYPETNRDRMLKHPSFLVKAKEGGVMVGALSYKAVKELFYTLQTPEVVSAIITPRQAEVILSSQSEIIPVTLICPDKAFWEIFEFTFVAGRPFDEAEFRSGIPIAVISESTAKRVFGTTEAVGKTFMVDFVEYRICGVVKDASYLTPDCYADVWIPYTCFTADMKKDDSWAGGWLGDFMTVYMLARSPEDKKQIKREINNKIDQVNRMDNNYQIRTEGFPDTRWENIFRGIDSRVSNRYEVILRQIGILLLLLLVPAVNLSGIISSRMDERISEIGVRKAFGASRHSLFAGIICENLFLTCLGGIIGLLFSVIIVWGGQNWIVDVLNEYNDPLPAGATVELSPFLLFHPLIFGITFLVCALLNLFSALIPAWRAMKRNIVESLNTK